MKHEPLSLFLSLLLVTGFVNGKMKSGYHVTFKIGSWKLEGGMYEPTEERVTQDPEKQSYDVYANPQEVFETINIQLNKANNQKEVFNINALISGFS